jgi:hypothetical protein
MSAEATDALDSFFGSYAQPWIGLWRCAAILGKAQLEAMALFWGLQRPDDQALSKLGQAMDLCMRTPPFLALMQHSLAMMSRPTCVGAAAHRFAFPVRFFEGGSSP